MSTFRERLFTNWHLMRIVRAGIGIMMLGMGIQSKDWLAGALGVFFLYQGITDTGCCGAQGCYTPRSRKLESIEDTAEYEEIK